MRLTPIAWTAGPAASLRTTVAGTVSATPPRYQPPGEVARLSPDRHRPRRGPRYPRPHGAGARATGDGGAARRLERRGDRGVRGDGRRRRRLVRHPDGPMAVPGVRDDLRVRHRRPLRHRGPGTRRPPADRGALPAGGPQP